MKFRCTFFVLLIIPCIAFSQPLFKNKKSPDAKVSVKKAAKYYLKKRHLPSPEFSIYYSSLFSGLQGYTKKDTLLANKVISRLYQFNDILFFRLMHIRLEWEFKQHLVFSLLDNIPSLLKNNIDSANYNYMLGIIFEDSLHERLARKFGYVRAVADNIEVPDWGKIRTFKFNNPAVWFGECHGLILDCNYTKYNIRFPIADSAILNYKKAVEISKYNFFYLKEFLIFLSKLGEEVKVQEIITSNLNHYNQEEKIWLNKYRIESVKRQATPIQIMEQL